MSEVQPHSILYMTNSASKRFKVHVCGHGKQTGGFVPNADNLQVAFDIADGLLFLYAPLLSRTYFQTSSSGSLPQAPHWSRLYTAAILELAEPISGGRCNRPKVGPREYQNSNDSLGAVLFIPHCTESRSDPLTTLQCRG